MKYEIHGQILQTVDIHLGPGEAIYTESGGMAWMRGQIDMTTNTRGGGLLGGLARSLAGESLFLTTYTAKGEGTITFAPEAPGEIMAIKLAAGQSIICQKDAFMCAEDDVKLELHFRKKLGAGLFGGEGFVLQKLTGPGTAFVEIAGLIREYQLQPGEVMKVDPGHIAMYEPTVDYDIQRVAGLKNVFFSGEGLFLATLKGPGKVWLQSMPLANLAQKLQSYMTIDKS